VKTFSLKFYFYLVKKIVALHILFFLDVALYTKKGKSNRKEIQNMKDVLCTLDIEHVMLVQLQGKKKCT